MKKNLLFTTFLILHFSLSFGQVTGGTVTIPGELSWKVGISGGPSFGFLLGNYKAKCDYLFTDGNGIGFYINGVATYPINYESDLYFSLGLQINSLNASQEKYRTKEIAGKLDTITGKLPMIDVKMLGEADLTLTYLNLEAYYKRKFLLDDLYFLVGFGLQLNLKSQIEQNETIKDDRFVFDLSGKSRDLIYKGDLENSNSILFSGRLGLGYDFLIKSKYIIAPQVVFCYPFSSLMSTDTWKVMYLNVGLQFLYVF
jgi:hypothetical protein